LWLERAAAHARCAPAHTRAGRCCESKCPAFCLGMETVCCFSLSVQTTRYMIQDELRIHTTKCDNCLIITMIVLEYIACVLHIVACIVGSEELRQAAQIVQIIADVMWCTVCACMQTQHKVEMDQRDTNPGAYTGAPPMAPPMQQAMPTYPQQQQQQGYPQQVSGSERGRGQAGGAAAARAGCCCEV
jgi:hypothetical protein